MSLFTSLTHLKTLIKHPKKPKRSKTFIKHPKKPKCPKTFIKHPKKPKRPKTKHRRSSSSISTHRSTSRTSYSGRQGRQRTYSRHSQRSHSPDRGRSTTRNLPRLTNDSTS